MNKKDINFFFEKLALLYPANTTELIRETPWQLLVAVVLSAQTTDKQVNKLTSSFFQTMQSPYDTLRYPPEERYQLIRWVNYAPTKAKHLYQTAQIIINNNKQWESNYIIPKDIQELMKLPWVGEKTAKVIRHVLYQTDDIAVDTHVHRVLNRLWFVHTKTALQTSKIVDEVIPNKYKQSAHHSLIMFGRYHCQARNPKFNGTLSEFRDYFHNEIESSLINNS